MQRANAPGIPRVVGVQMRYTRTDSHARGATQEHSQLEHLMIESTAMTNPASSVSRAAAVLSWELAAIAAVSLAALHALSPELDPTWRMVSEYAIGHFSWALSLMFLATALSCIALFIAIKPHIRTRGGAIGRVLLLTASLGMAMASVFDVTQGMHATATFIGIPSLLASAMLITIGLARNNQDWAPQRRLLLVLANLVWISLVVMVAALFIGLSQSGGKFGPGVLIGWPNRILMFAYEAWLIVVALRVVQLHKNHALPQPDHSTNFDN
jgi:uncharacterized protein DUF998